MKPLILSMKNIGPFRHETIDFTSLGDMFLISGKTGSGKTTIFDAMTYALYGDFAGARKKQAASFRSHFASPGEESFVEFTFRIDSRTYRVHRTLPVSYTNRNGKEAVKDTEVTLEAKDDGGNWKTFDGKKNETNEKIEKDIIHLSASEFNQIVLLPQGSFAEFLRAGSNEKRETLSKLFNVDFYKSIAERAKENADKCKADSSILESKLRDAKENFSAEDAQKQVAFFDEQIVRLKQQNELLQKQNVDCTANIEKEKNSLASVRKAQELLTHKAKLDEEKSSIDDLAQKLQRSSAAQKLSQPLHAKTDLLQRKTKCEQDIASASSFAAQSSETVTALCEQTDEMENLSKQTEADSRTLDELNKRLTLVQKITDAQNAKAQTESQLQQAKSEAAEIAHGIVLTVQELVQASEENKKQCAEADKLCADTTSIIQELTAQQKASEQASIASTLASVLKENEPCPVCGSTVHPHPAEKNIHVLSLEEKINAENHHLENAQKNADSLHAESVRFETTLSSLSETERASAKAQAAGTFRTAQELSSALTKLRSQKTDAEQAVSKLESQYAAAQASLEQIAISAGTETDIAKLRAQIRIAADSIEKNKDSYNLWQNQKAQAEKEQAKAEATVATLRQSLVSLTAEYSDAENSFSAALALSPFANDKEAKDALLDSKTENEYREKIDSWKEDSQKTEALLSEQQTKSLSGSEQDSVPIDSNQLQTMLTKTETELAALKQTQETILASLSDTSEKLNKISVERANNAQRIELVARLEKEFAELGEKSEAVRKLSDDLNGHNSKNTPLDAWVLAMYFEEVVEYANPRFARISGGRYQFKINTNATGGNSMRGLDLLVTDSYTGKDRDTATLSGGETFMASISLALALTDVVQNRSGGIRLDSLFIDEGFGTLDGDSLDMAVNVLRGIQEQRVVGIVSHVESLESVIPSMLEVIKGTAGSTVKIR